MNFMRYLAMRGRIPEPHFAPLERSINWIANGWLRRGSRPTTAEANAKVPPGEAAIVCMAILALGPNPVATHPVDYDELKMSEDKILAKALNKHEQEFGLPSTDDWAWYDEIVGEVSVN